jgi:hypothetical protein
MTFQLKGEAFQIPVSKGHYSIDWAISALKLLNLLIGMIIFVILTFDISYYLGMTKGLIDPALIPPDLPALTTITILMLFTPMVINRVAIADLSSNTNTPVSVWDIVTGEGISFGLEGNYSETTRQRDNIYFNP